MGVGDKDKGKDAGKVWAPTGERMWHKNGHYSIIVVSFEEKGGVPWLTYFVEQNCDRTYEKHADTFVRLNVGGEDLDREGLVWERCYEDNTLRVMSADRAATKFVGEKPKSRKKLTLHRLKAEPEGDFRHLEEIMRKHQAEERRTREKGGDGHVSG